MEIIKNIEGVEGKEHKIILDYEDVEDLNNNKDLVNLSVGKKKTLLIYIAEFPNDKLNHYLEKLSINKQIEESDKAIGVKRK